MRWQIGPRRAFGRGEETLSGSHIFADDLQIYDDVMLCGTIELCDGDGEKE